MRTITKSGFDEATLTKSVLPAAKKTLITSLCFILFNMASYSQDGDHVDGGVFTKLIEFNRIYSDNNYNFNSKGDIEKLFFGDFNASVEFFFEPSFEGASGFRIVVNSSGKANTIEIKRISNYQEAQSEARKNYKPIGISNPMDISKENKAKIVDHNREMNQKFREALPNLYKVETLSYTISDQFAEKMHKMMTLLIGNFKARGGPIQIQENGGVLIRFIGDGDRVNFRTVVDEEVWSLRIHEPTGDALRMANLCRQIINETVKNKKFDEASYIELHDDF